MAGHHLAPVWRQPAVLGGKLGDLVAVAAPVDERPEAESREDLGQLGGVTERVRCVGGRRAGSPVRGHPPAFQQVADVGLARRQEGVGLHVPGTDGDAFLPARRGQLVAAIGADGRVVLEDDGLAVELEVEAGILGDQVEHPVDGVDEPGPERLERPIPLPVPVGVRDQDASHRDRAPVLGGLDVVRVVLPRSALLLHLLDAAKHVPAAHLPEQPVALDDWEAADRLVAEVER